MKKTQQTIEIQAIVKTSLEGLDATVKQLQDKLKSGNLQIDLTKGVGKDLSKLISNFETSFSRIKQMTPDNLLQITDSKEFQKESNNIIKSITEIQRITGDLTTKGILDVKKLFPNSFDTRVTELLTSIEKVGSTLELLEQKRGAFSKLEIEVQGLTAQIKELNDLASNKNDIAKMASEAEAALGQTEQKIEDLRKKFAEEIKLKVSLEDIEKANKAIEENSKKLKELETKGISKSSKGKAVYQGMGIGEWRQTAKDNPAQKEQAKQAIALLQEYNKINAALIQQQQILKENAKLQEILQKSPDLQDDKSLKAAGSVLKQQDEVKRAFEARAQAAERAKQAQQQLNRAESADSKIGGLQEEITKKTQQMKELEVVIKSLTANSNLAELAAKFKEITNIDVSPTKEGLAQMAKELQRIDDKAYKDLIASLQKLGITLPDTTGKMQDLRKGADSAKDSVRQFNERTQEMEQLANRIKYFFGLTNSIHLFKRAVTGALNTVKELDATMTEAAVVTDFSVGDMWDKLPEYSANAQKLGVSINGMYQATTLYYQQGLKSNEAMALGIETMKMGKIAAMDSTEATKAMTAALRGFNMELNETSATRVNDVYSQLAAITAADTNQIATAMEKTASIAAAANMEFETTAALLAQIIETTQEAPETAGTAMKTIIARFSEVKSLQNQGLTSGKDSEGEDLDVNKIQTALKSVGISMDGFFQGTEGLDSILLKLAEKWEGLDFQTQRYIATMAAGSRQQSRFIAMMSDYERTTELVSEAQDSAGASQRQFNKTQDSMESKLQRLENAWNEFLMGLTNNEILKGAIDVLTFIVDGINKVTDALSGGNGLIKSIVSLAAVVGALKLGKSLFGNVLGWTGQQMGMPGQNNQTETITKTTDDQGRTVEAIIRNPAQQGQQAGQQAGQGFINGFRNAISTGRAGGNILEGFFTTGPAQGITGENIGKKYAGKYTEKAKKIKAKHENMAGTELINKYKEGTDFKTSRKGYMDEIVARNQNFDQKQITQISDAYKQVIANGGSMEQAMGAANGKVKELNGTLMTSSQTEQMMAEQTNGLQLNMGALGGAAIGVGGALSLLSSLFGALGMDEAAESTGILASIFIGLGSVMSTLSLIAPKLGMSFTTAGIQITIAGETSQLAWWWVFLIIAAVALLVVGVIALAKAWENASDEAQLEKMNEQIEGLGAAADEAKQKLEDMASAREDLEDLGSAFDGLVKGSREWKKALIENNQKVLELINTYPELAEYVSKGLNGELTIDQKGWEALEDQQMARYTAALNAETALTQQRDEKELEMQTESIMAEAWAKTPEADLVGGVAGTIQGGVLMQKYGMTNDEYQAKLMQKRMDNAEFFETTGGKWAGAASGAVAGAAVGAAIGSIIPVIGTAIGATLGTVIGGVAGAFGRESVEDVQRDQTGGLTYDEFNEFGALAAERGLSLSGGSSKKEFKDLYLEMGYDEASFESVWTSMQNMGASFDELANSAMAVSMAEQARADSIAASVAQTSAIVQGSEEFGVVAEEMGAQAFTKYDDKVAAKADSYLEDMDTKDLESGEAADAIAKYAKIQGISEAEVRRQIENEEIAKEDIANIIAAQDVNEEMKKAMEGTVKVLDRISKGKSDREMAEIKGLMTDRGIGMGISSIQNMPTTQEGMREYLESQGFDEEDAKAMGYETMDALAQGMLTNAKNAQAAFDNAFNIDNTFNMGQQFKIQINSLNNSLLQLGSTTGLTVGQTQMLANSLAKVTANGGDAAALLRQFPSLLQGLSGKDLDNAINLLATTDWTTQNGIETTIAALESLGVTVEDHMVEQLYIATQAVKKFDLSAMEEKLSNLQSLIDKVTEKADEGSKSFTKEERDALVAGGFGEDMFVRIGIDEYTFMGDTESLLASIENYVSAILGEMRGDVDEAVAKGEGFDEVFQNDGKVYAVGNGTEGSTTGKEMTGEQIIQRLATGELDTLGVGGTNNVGRRTLEQLVKDTGVLDDVNWSGYTDYMLAEALVQGYTNYYGPGGMKYKQNKETQNQVNSETLSIEYAQAAGTREFYNLYDQDLAKRQKASEIEGITVDTSALGWEYGAFHQSGRNQYENIGGGTTSYTMTTDANGYTNYHQQTSFDPQQLLQSVATQEDFAELYQYDPTVLSGMRGLGVELGIDGAAGMDFDLLQQQLTAYYDSMYRGDQVLDALIESEAGLDVAVDQATQQLVDQGSDLSKNSVLIKQLVLANNQANKNMDNLNETLEEQSDAFKLGNKNSAQYRTALSKVTAAAKKVFGSDITEEFVHENRELFEQLAEGGKTGQAAYEELGRRAAAAFLGMEHDSQEFANVLNAAMAGVPTDLEIGASFDATEAINNLMALGYTAEEAAAIMEKMGFSVTYTTETHHIGDVTGTDYGVSAPGATVDNESTTATSVVVASATKNDSAGTGFSGGGGGGGGGGGDKWENPYDKLHNILEEINDLLREREKLERRYQRLVSQGTATAEKLSQISNDNVSNYQDEIAKQEYIIAGRKAQVQAKIKANPDMEKYVYTDVDAMGNETIRIDWDAINAITDSEEGEKVSEFYDDIDEWLESIYDAEESILEAEDGIWEELQQGKDEYLDLEEQVKEAIVNQRQEEIDKLSAINDSINDTNSRLLEAMQSSIDKYRQDRENQKTEEELSDKQRRLAYLQQDTSGANDLEIMKLQEEIDQGQQDYTDSLIDQKISELQEQNDKAAEQRQQQIDIMQAQLDKYVESGEIWQEVSDLIATGTDAAQNLVKGSELETLLKSSAGFEGMSNVQKMAWLQDTNVLIAQALKWLSDGAVSSFSTGQEVTFKTGDGKTITGKANAQGEVEADGQIYKDVSMDAYGNYSTKETVEDAKNEYTHRAEEKKKADEEAAFNARFPFGRPSDISRNLWRGHSGTDVKALQQALNELGFNAGEVDGIFGGQTWNALTKFKNKYGGHGEYGMQSKTKAAFKAIEYKTGGLADFTGPAWLDGTRSKPEYILNADQTKAFFTLVDVLGSLQAGNSKTAQNSGDNTYDIDINVESIGSDYDVEQLAATVKRLINEDARYRNNNAINLMR